MTLHAGYAARRIRSKLKGIRMVAGPRTQIFFSFNNFHKLCNHPRCSVNSVPFGVE